MVLDGSGLVSFWEVLTTFEAVLYANSALKLHKEIFKICKNNQFLMEFQGFRGGSGQKNSLSWSLEQSSDHF